MYESRNESNIMKTIGILLNNITSKTSPIAGHVIKEITQIPDCQICVFSNKTMSLSDIDACIMSVGTIVSFTGDVVCFNSDDALLCLQSNRDMNIKYLLTEDTISDIAELLPYYKRVEFLIPNETYKPYTSALIEDNLRTADEYFNEKR